MIRLLTLTFLALITFNASISAADIGKTIPHTLEIPNHNDEKQSFENLKGEKGLVLVFVRSVDWCPYCQKQLIELNPHMKDINDQGYNLAALSYDTIEKQNSFAEKNDIDFTLLSDQNSEVIKAFNILNTDIEPKTSYYGVPHPTIYIIDNEGTIQAVLAEDGYKARPSIEAIMNAIEQE
ncbi:MAG: peroxiredoxin family protein [Micavibrio sp.]|nr:peroxiredoxin family protein [Micavibrio sp.]